MTSKAFFLTSVSVALAVSVFIISRGPNLPWNAQLVSCWAASDNGSCPASHPIDQGSGCYATEDASCKCGPSQDGICGAGSCLCPVGICCSNRQSTQSGVYEQDCQSSSDEWRMGNDTSWCMGDGGSMMGDTGVDEEADPVPGDCTNIDCNDSNACTTDSCSNGVCSHNAISCPNDNDRCTSASCDSVNGCGQSPNSVCFCGDGVVDAPEQCEEGFGCESCACGPHFVFNEGVCQCRADMSFDGIDDCECDDPLMHIDPDLNICVRCGDKEHWDPNTESCEPDKCHDCEEKCNIDNDKFNRGALDPDSIACRIDCADSYVGVGGDSCSALCSGGNSVNGAELCPDARTCCAGISHCVDGDGDGLYSCYSPPSPGSPGSPGTTPGSPGNPGGGPGSGPGSPGSPGTNDNDDSNDDPNPPQGSSSAASSVSSCYATQADAPSAQDLCNVCDPACSLECMCGLGYPNALDMNDPASVAQWRFNSNFCSHQCDEDPPDTPTFPPTSQSSQAPTSSAQSSAASSECPADQTFCALQMNIACYCPGLVTYHNCSAGSCFACPVCPAANSSQSSTSSNNFDLCSSPKLEEKMCEDLSRTAEQFDINIDIEENCFTQQICTECDNKTGNCSKTCITAQCDQQDGFSWNAETTPCAGGQCETQQCATDKDCLQPVCAGCGYDKDANACQKTCNSMMCFSGECVVVLEEPIQCEDECSVCDTKDRPECAEGESAHCCDSKDWKCVGNGVSEDIIEGLICKTEPSDGSSSSVSSTPVSSTGNSAVVSSQFSNSVESKSSLSGFQSSTIIAQGLPSSSIEQQSSPNATSSESEDAASSAAQSQQSSILADDFSGFESSSISVASQSSSEGLASPSSESNSSVASLFLAFDSDSSAGNGDEDDGIKGNQRDDDNGDGDNDDGTPGNQTDLIRVLAQQDTLVAAAPVCGNGILEKSEECDDTNRRDNDGCSSTCLLEIGICGDGIVQTLLGEQCELSTHASGLPYSCQNCRFVSLFCGDGKLDSGEECDQGPLNSTSADADCRPDCSLSRCGDAVLDTAEICDDGNRRNNDGCDRYCRVEESDTTGVTVIAADQNLIDFNNTAPIFTQYQGNVQFPQYPNFQQLPYQLPLAQLRPLISPQGVAGETGPAAVAVVASGMAAGFGWMRRKKRK